jgi:hypothetical protein
VKACSPGPIEIKAPYQQVLQDTRGHCEGLGLRCQKVLSLNRAEQSVRLQLFQLGNKPQEYHQKGLLVAANLVGRSEMLVFAVE